MNTSGCYDRRDRRLCGGRGCARCGVLVDGVYVAVRRVLVDDQANVQPPVTLRDRDSGSAFAAFGNSRFMLADDPSYMGCSREDPEQAQDWRHARKYHYDEDDDLMG